MDTLRALNDQEQYALAVLDAEGMDEAMRVTGLTREQIVEANNVQAAHKRVNGGVAVAEPDPVDAPVPVVDLVLPQRPAPADVLGAADSAGDAATVPTDDAVSRLAELLSRADMVGGVRARFLAARIREDAAELAEELAVDEATWTARNRVEDLRGQLADAEAELRALGGTPAPAPRKAAARKTGAKKTAKPAKRTGRRAEGGALPYNRLVREWAQANGFEVGGSGRLPNAVVEAYRDARGGVA